MTTEQRAEIVSLCRKAGIATLRIEEIESGCRIDRVRQIITQQLGSCEPGTLVLSDPHAAAQALERAYSVD